MRDGGSNDNSVSILKTYSEWISYWESEKDRGQSHALNLGFSLATGEIYCWLNSDDYFCRGALKQVALAFITNKVAFVYGDCYDLKDTVLEPYFSPIVFDRYLCIPGIAQPSVFWSSAIHQPLWEELNCTLDFELWMRMAKGVKKKYLPAFLSTARVHEESKTHSTDLRSKEKWQEDHDRQWKVHGPVPAWYRLSKENRCIQKMFSFLPLLKKMF